MDIQKLEQIVLSDAKTEAQQLIDQTKEEMKAWFLEQSTLLNNTHQDEIERIKSDHMSLLSTIKTSLETELHKQIGKEKKEKMTVLKKELLKALQNKLAKDPEWFLTLAFSQLTLKEGSLLVSDDLKNELKQSPIEIFLAKFPGYKWAGYSKDIDSGLMIESNSVRYLFPLEEIVDAFIDKQTETINDLLNP